MLDIRNLTDEELVRHAVTRDALSPLELELTLRLEATLDRIEEPELPAWAKPLLED